MIRRAEMGKNDHPALGKFMLLSDDYEAFKFGGSFPKDEECGIKTIPKYFLQILRKSS